MNPINVATVTSCQCRSSHDSRCENETIPATAPARNSASTGIFSSPTACKINWYLPNSSKMNAPEMPGRIMAQMAMAPDSMMNHHVSGVSAGEATVIHHATAMPASKAAALRQSHFPTCRATSSAEATISPKKNDHTATGWFVSR